MTHAQGIEDAGKAPGQARYEACVCGDNNAWEKLSLAERCEWAQQDASTQGMWTLGKGSDGWPAIILPDGTQRWPNSVWRASSSNVERVLMTAIVEAHNWSMEPRP